MDSSGPAVEVVDIARAECRATRSARAGKGAVCEDEGCTGGGLGVGCSEEGQRSRVLWRCDHLRRLTLHSEMINLNFKFNCSNCRNSTSKK